MTLQEFGKWGIGRPAVDMRGLVTKLAQALRKLVAPSYRPELHYMRGPGPACARRRRALDAAHGPKRSR